MSPTMPMLDTYPREINLDRRALALAIDTIIECGEACTACADACLSEGMVAELARCIRTNMDCADICTATARVLSRHTDDDANLSRAMLDACLIACQSCADECARHADAHEHCRICATACRECVRVCRELMAAMT